MSCQNHERKRIYQVWPGKNKFCCGGRLVFGPDASSLLLTTCMIGGPAITFYIRMACLIRDRHPLFHSLVLMGAILLTILDFTFLYMTSTRDPGIIPRNKEAPMAESPEVITHSLEWVSDKVGNVKLPRTKDIMVNGFTVKVKFCHTCQLYRPPRASHCSICNNCVQRFDHHCPWVGQCIALRNYPFFVCFLSCSTLLCIYFFVFSWTTCENFRYHYDKKQNPYRKGVLKNFMELFFAKIPPPLINFREWAPEEEKEDDVEVGSIAFGSRRHGNEQWNHYSLNLRLQKLEYGNNSDATVKKMCRIDEGAASIGPVYRTSEFKEKLKLCLHLSYFCNSKPCTSLSLAESVFTRQNDF